MHIFVQAYPDAMRAYRVCLWQARHEQSRFSISQIQRPKVTLFLDSEHVMKVGLLPAHIFCGSNAEGC